MVHDLTTKTNAHLDLVAFSGEWVAVISSSLSRRSRKEPPVSVRGRLNLNLEWLFSFQKVVEKISPACRPLPEPENDDVPVAKNRLTFLDGEAPGNEGTRSGKIEPPEDISLPTGARKSFDGHLSGPSRERVSMGSRTIGRNAVGVVGYDGSVNHRTRGR